MAEPELLELEHLQQQRSRLQYLEQIQKDQDTEMLQIQQGLQDISPPDRRKALQGFYKGLGEQKEEIALNKKMMTRQSELVDLLEQKSLSPTDKILFDRLQQEHIKQKKFLADLEVYKTQQEEKFNQLQEDMQGNSYRENLPGGKLRHGWNWAVGGLSFNTTDSGGYYRVAGNGDKNPYTGKRVPSDKQLRETILRLVKEEGCDTLYAYKGNQIDPQLTSRMKSMLSSMMKPGHVLDGYNVRVSDNRMPELEPWRGTNFLTRPFAQASRGFQDWKEERAYQKSERKTIAEENRSPWMPKLPFT